METINSLVNEKVKYALKLNQKKYRDKYNKFIVEGYKNIYELYICNVKIDYVFILESEVLKYEFIKEKIIITNENILKKISSTDSSPKALAVANKIENNIEITKKNKIAVYENIKDPGNLGTLIRSACAFGIEAIILLGNTVDIYNPKVLRASCGNFFKIPIYNLKSLEEIKENFKEHKIIGTFVNNGISVNKFKFPEKYLLMFGSEAFGLKCKTKDLCDYKITIPINKNVESLNLSVASGIIFYQSFISHKN